MNNLSFGEVEELTTPERIVVVDYHIFHPTYMCYHEKGYVKSKYIYNPEEQGTIATDKELFEALKNLVGDEDDVVIDISCHAVSFIEYIRHNSNYKIHRRRN